MLTHAPGGTVWASSRGLIRSGRSEGAALAALADAVRRVERQEPRADDPAAVALAAMLRRGG